MFSVEINCPFTRRTRFEAANKYVCVVVLDVLLRNERRGCVGAQIEAADCFLNPACGITVAKMNRVSWAEIIVAFYRVLNLAVLRKGIDIAVGKPDGVGGCAAGN